MQRRKNDDHVLNAESKAKNVKTSQVVLFRIQYRLIKGLLRIIVFFFFFFFFFFLEEIVEGDFSQQSRPPSHGLD